MFQRIFIDATYTLSSGKNSGIERVVRSLWHQSQQLAGEGLIPQPQQIVSIEGKFFAPAAEQLELFRRPAAMHANVLSMMPSGYRLAAQAVCRMTGSRKLRKWILPQAGHLGWFKLPHNMFEAQVRRQIVSQSTEVDFQPQDLIVLPDAYWVNRLRSSVWPAAERARAAGAQVATILYDLIPLTHAHFVGEKRRTAFLEYLKQAAQHSDLLLAISQTVRDQVAEYLPSIFSDGEDYCRQVCAFQLGAELDNVSGAVRPAVRELFDTGVPPYLMVATFDPRKNHQYLLDAFEQLWHSRPDIKLCLVGRIGSRCEDIVSRILQHPLLNQNLFLFTDLSDAELHHCYAQARGVVFPSIVEGFGLPIVESLWFGKRTFVSDTPIHREVGLGDCCYFSLDDAGSLAQEIVDWEQQLAFDPHPRLPIRRPVSWRASAEQVFQHCLQQLGEPTQPPGLASDADVAGPMHRAA